MGVTDKDGLVPEDADEAEHFGSQLENLKEPLPVHGAKHIVDIHRDVVERCLLTSGKRCDQALLGFLGNEWQRRGGGRATTQAAASQTVARYGS